MSPTAARRKVTEPAAAARNAVADQRIEVRKTYKLYIGGAFPRSESGRTYEVRDSHDRFLANAAMGSRKDSRDAVVAARGAFTKWAGATAYNRGQVLYRVAELMEGRRAQFAIEVAAAEGLTPARADKVVSQAIDRWVWYAGWADKLAQVLGGVNPVAGPYFNISAPEPTGVVAALAPQKSSLLGLVSVLAPIVVSGNTAVVLTSEHRPLPAITLSEVLATSDVPAGVINVITGRTAEVAPWLAATRTSTRSTLPAPPTAATSRGQSSNGPAPRTSSGSCGRLATEPTPSSPTGPAHRT